MHSTLGRVDSSFYLEYPQSNVCWSRGKRVRPRVELLYGLSICCYGLMINQINNLLYVEIHMSIKSEMHELIVFRAVVKIEHKF
jgi:hypothetical protein